MAKLFAFTNLDLDKLPVWLNTKEASLVLGLQPCTLEKWRKQGKGPSFNKVGSRVRYDHKELVAFLKAADRAPSA